MSNIPQNKENGTTKDGRYRNWTIIAYPESAPADWREKLNGLQWVESPLHDHDINPDGTPKKPHWHIMIQNQGKISYQQAKVIADLIFGASPEYVKNVVGMVRYFAHLDNPEKYQYDPSGIIGHGIDVSQYLQTEADIERMVCDIEDYIDDNRITEYAELCRACRRMEEHPDWHKCVDTHTVHFKAYINSCRHAPKMPDPEPEDKLEELADAALSPKPTEEGRVEGVQTPHQGAVGAVPMERSGIGSAETAGRKPEGVGGDSPPPS